MIAPALRVDSACGFGSTAIRLMAVALAFASGFASPARPQETAGPVVAQQADPLVGLWKARLDFGPDVRGRMILERTAVGWRADFIGSTFALQRQGDVLSFSLPGGRGSFRAKLTADGSVHHGQWIQQASPTNPLFATGVRFTADGKDRWQGEVQPIDDTLTFYLPVTRRPDGTLGTFIRSPERNIGIFYKADRIEREGDRIRVMGRAPGDKADSALLEGSYDTGNDVMNLRFPASGVSFDFRREGDASDFYPRGKHPARYVYHPPLARDDGWPTGTLAEADIDQAGIESFIQRLAETPMDSLDSQQVDGILIARHGKLVLEEYFHGNDRDHPHETRSASKSLTATLVGAAMQAGLPVRLSMPVYATMYDGKTPNELEPRKRAMTLENLLTMSSGFYCDDSDLKAPGREDTMTDDSKEPDYYKYTLAVPMAYDPGKVAVYCSVNPNLAIGVLWHATGEHPMDLFDRLLGEPLKIDRDAWSLSPALQPYGGGGARLVPRDFMKLGQLVLNGGRWNGRRVLSEDFVKRASSPLYDLNKIKYGYLWWGIDFPYKDRTVHAFFAGGNGGQGVLVIPELDMVIATYGANYASRVSLEIQQGLTPRYILPAVREPGDPKDTPVVPRDFTVTYGYTKK